MYSIEATAPLLWAVADAAHGAGFRDPRFMSLQVHELHEVSIEVSVLSPMEALAIEGRDELFDALRPHLDG